jgi:hypothetical protein
MPLLPELIEVGLCPERQGSQGAGVQVGVGLQDGELGPGVLE